MSQPKKHIVFDVVGTCISFDAFFTRIDEVLGRRLRTDNVDAKIFGLTWMQAAEMEYTFILMSGRYTPYKKVFKQIFYRVLFMSEIPEPRSFATDQERDTCQAAYSKLELHPGCCEMMRKDAQPVSRYFTRARFDMSPENLPSMGAYKPMLEKFTPGDQKWFAAAHMWDVSAAIKAGPGNSAAESRAPTFGTARHGQEADT
ncbi:hypothetical protein BDV06DRAFT_232269 [Aspergillus oleicola]